MMNPANAYSQASYPVPQPAFFPGAPVAPASYLLPPSSPDQQYPYGAPPQPASYVAPMTPGQAAPYGLPPSPATMDNFMTQAAQLGQPTAQAPGGMLGAPGAGGPGGPGADPNEMSLEQLLAALGAGGPQGGMGAPGDMMANPMGGLGGGSSSLVANPDGSIQEAAPYRSSGGGLLGWLSSPVNALKAAGAVAIALGVGALFFKRSPSAAGETATATAKDLYASLKAQVKEAMTAGAEQVDAAKAAVQDVRTQLVEHLRANPDDLAHIEPTSKHGRAKLAELAAAQDAAATATDTARKEIIEQAVHDLVVRDERAGIAAQMKELEALATRSDEQNQLLQSLQALKDKKGISEALTPPPPAPATPTT